MWCGDKTRVLDADTQPFLWSNTIRHKTIRHKCVGHWHPPFYVACWFVLWTQDQSVCWTLTLAILCIMDTRPDRVFGGHWRQPFYVAFWFVLWTQDQCWTLTPAILCSILICAVSTRPGMVGRVRTNKLFILFQWSKTCALDTGIFLFRFVFYLEVMLRHV